jgi:hypothetical protein
VGDDGDIAQVFDRHGIDSGGAQAVTQVFEGRINRLYALARQLARGFVQAVKGGEARPGQDIAAGWRRGLITPAQPALSLAEGLREYQGSMHTALAHKT